MKYLVATTMTLGSVVGTLALLTGRWYDVAGGFIAIPIGLLWFLRERSRTA